MGIGNNNNFPGIPASHGSSHPHSDPTWIFLHFHPSLPHLDPASTWKNGNFSTPIHSSRSKEQIQALDNDLNEFSPFQSLIPGFSELPSEHGAGETLEVEIPSHPRFSGAGNLSRSGCII